MDEVKVIKPAEVESHILPGGTVVKRFITQEKDASCFILGLATIEPGADHEINVTLQGKDEAYYMLKGKLSLVTSDGKLEVKEGDAVLFRSGERHRVRNIGNGPAILLYVIFQAVR